MLKNLLSKYSILKITIFFSWVALWISINSVPSEILLMDQGLIRFFNGIKSINAIFFAILSIFLALFFYLKSYKKTKSFILVIFSIHFFSQIIGLLLNNERVIELNNIYLILYAFGTISILFLIKNFNLYDLISIMMSFVGLILFASVVYILVSNFDQLKLTLENVNLYYLINPNIEIHFQSQPRITGLSRSVAIITIYLIILFILNEKKIYSYFYLIPIFILSTFIWMAQSRGTIICFYFSSAILIFLFNNLSNYKKILLFLFISYFSVISADLVYQFKNTFPKVKDSINYNNDINHKNEIKKLEKEKEKEKELKSRFLIQKDNPSSGRTILWKRALQGFDKKKIFGYGPQADRIILDDPRNPWSNNVSNALLYALLSGGYLSIICVGLIYIYFSILFIKFFIKKKLYKKAYELKSDNKIYITSIIFIIFFMTRSLVENSFSLFSIDFLITIISLFIFENYKSIKNKSTI
jgi:hypothetical protein